MVKVIHILTSEEISELQKLIDDAMSIAGSIWDTRDIGDILNRIAEILGLEVSMTDKPNTYCHDCKWKSDYLFQCNFLCTHKNSIYMNDERASCYTMCRDRNMNDDCSDYEKREARDGDRS